MITVRFLVNGKQCEVTTQPLARLSDTLRNELELTGTKVGCDAGDCGACTVRLNGRQVCACLVPVAHAHGAVVDTVEGLSTSHLSALQVAFAQFGAAQCGICTPGMLMAASTVLDGPPPTKEEVHDALGGVLCRCTGYRKIVEAVMSVAYGKGPTDSASPSSGVGARALGIDAEAKVTGRALFGADTQVSGALALRVVRSPHSHAAFELGDCGQLLDRHPGLVRVLTAADIPGCNGFGVYSDLKDQPVLAQGVTRFRGEPVCALVGTEEALRAVVDEEIPLRWEPRDALVTTGQALSAHAQPVNPCFDTNVLTEGIVRSGIIPGVGPITTVSARFETPFVEHAYIEPEAGFARRISGPDGIDHVEVAASTQTPYMDRDEVANVLGIAPERVRIRPTACGGGFGGKLDQSVQPLIALATWLLHRPVRWVYTRGESMASTTKRHPATMQGRALADASGQLLGFEFRGDFNTGAYASWGPTVAGRVPVHCMGPYRVANVDTRARAIFTNGPPSGAFRGFGVPQAAIVHETLIDEIAVRQGTDPLRFRRRNALRAGDVTATGQVLGASVGLIECLDRLTPSWEALRAQAQAHNATAPRERLGVGVACMWYGCGNTSMSNPSTMRITLSRGGEITFYNGAQDIGQGAATVLAQIAAQTLGVPLERIGHVGADTALTSDAGKSSASRQTFVSGKATQLAAENLRQQLAQLANVGPDAEICFDGTTARLDDGAVVRTLDLKSLPVVAGEKVVAEGWGTFDPPTTPLDANGQGAPYATYAFAAQVALISVDLDLGTVRVRKIVAAHDVGRAINPTLVEGQIEGGIAQGIGLALMEEYIPGRTENLHDYLIPSIGDVPEIECILVEDPEPLGPFGAKGIGEPALIPTAPAILNALHHATGVRARQIPLLPHRVREAIAAGGTYAKS